MRKFFKELTLYLGMYATTTLVVGIETGDFLKGMKIAIFTATLKIVVVKIHEWCWKQHHSPAIVVKEALTELSHDV